MELMLIVWSISILKPVTALLGLTAVLSLIGMFVLCMANIDAGGAIKNRWFVLVAFIGIWSTILATVLPTEKTAYAMAAAYTAQAIYENPKVQQLSEKAIAVIEQKLDEQLKK